jgi:hypothetical protein
MSGETSIQVNQIDQVEMFFPDCIRLQNGMDVFSVYV